MSERLYQGVYDYETFPQSFTKSKIERYYKSQLTQWSLLTKNWNDELNTEWIARNYLATKMIFSTTLMLNSVEHSAKKNIKIVEPYLLYYAMFTACRALVLTLPSLKWDEGSIMKYTHQKTINLAVDIIKLFDQEQAVKINKLLIRAKDYRELFSYKFPSNGIISLPSEVTVTLEQATDFCRLMVEIAQFNSEILHQSFSKNVPETEIFHANQSIIEKCVWYETDDYTFVDDEDHYRIERLIRKEKTPASLVLMTSAGMVDDFFGAWIDEEKDEDDGFDPDLNVRLIFDFP